MRKIDSRGKFTFHVQPSNISHQAQLYWSGPSGKKHYVKRLERWEFEHGMIGTTVTAESIWFGSMLGCLRDKYPKSKWLNLVCDGYERHATPYYRARARGLRHNLDRQERQELGRLVSDFVNHPDFERAEDIVGFLHDSHATQNVLDKFPSALTSEGARHRVVLGRCDHFVTVYDGFKTNNGQYVCRNCVDREDYVQPEDSSQYYPADELYEHGDGLLYTYEEDEDEEEEGDDGLRSYDANVNSILGGASFASTPNGPFTIGVELEVHARRHERSALVDTVTSQAGKDIICKSDGSLDDERGVELVSRPLSFEETIGLFSHLEFPEGTIAWDAECCGLHVHIDSRAFTALSIAKFLAFWNDAGNAKFIRKVAGRHPDFDSQAQDYAARVEATGSTTLRKAKDHRHGDTRYRIVNLCNLGDGETERLRLAEHDSSGNTYNTVELRIFRASLRKARLLAQIEFAVASVYFARDTSLQYVSAKDFLTWLGRNTARFPHLTSFLKITRPMVPNPQARVTDDETSEID